MSKRILLTEWGVEPRVYGLDEFITAQTIDGFGNPLTPEEGQMLEEEIERLNAMQIGEKVRIGDPDCTEIFVERINGPVPEYRMIDGELKLDGPVTVEVSEDTYEKLSDLASDRNSSLGEALVLAVNIMTARTFPFRS